MKKVVFFAIAGMLVAPLCAMQDQKAGRVIQGIAGLLRQSNQKLQFAIPQKIKATIKATIKEENRIREIGRESGLADIDNYVIKMSTKSISGQCYFIGDKGHIEINPDYAREHSEESIAGTLYHEREHLRQDHIFKRRISTYIGGLVYLATVWGLNERNDVYNENNPDRILLRIQNNILAASMGMISRNIFGNWIIRKQEKEADLSFSHKPEICKAEADYFESKAQEKRAEFEAVFGKTIVGHVYDNIHNPWIYGPFEALCDLGHPLDIRRAHYLKKAARRAEQGECSKDDTIKPWWKLW